jgi:hypothetical protein
MEVDIATREPARPRVLLCHHGIYRQTGRLQSSRCRLHDAGQASAEAWNSHILKAQMTATPARRQIPTLHETDRLCDEACS